MGEVAANEYTTFKFEDVADHAEADDVDGKDQEMTDLVSLRFSNCQVVFKSRNSLQNG